MNWKKVLPASLLVLTILGALLLVACDDRTGNPVTHKIARMEVSPDTIYADNNITYSTVWVYVKDNNGFPVPGQRVSFKSSKGTIEASKDTDSSGVAEALFWDSGEMGVAEIFAFVGGDNAKRTVTIEEAPGIQDINLTIGASSMKVNRTTDISATVINDQNMIVDDGTIVVFDCTRGYFTDGVQGTSDLGTRIQATTSNGIATVTFNSGTQKGVSTIIAKVGTKSETGDIVINPGAGVSIDLQVPSQTLEVGDQVEIAAIVYDAYSNTVKPQTVVNFETDLGSIPTSAATDTDGAAHVTFSSGAEAGLATITATADSATAQAAVTILSDEVASLEFPTTEIVLDCEGTGGVESAQLAVTLKDMNGNVVDDDATVWFTFATTPPDGCHIGETVYAVGDSIAIPALSGVATVSINSGETPGTVRVKAYTYTELGNKVTSTKSNIVIQAGPPYAITLEIGEYDTGNEYGSGAWQVGLAAYVVDQVGNAVAYNTAVHFSLESEIDSVTVFAYGFTGNMSIDGDSLQGVAFSWVAYDGSHSNDYITVRATSGDVFGEAELRLPMNQPVLDCHPILGHYDWANGNHAAVIGEILCVVYDSQGNYIHDAIIHCSAPRGEFVNPAPEYQTDLGPQFVKTDYDGHAIARIMFEELECPPVVPPPNEVPVEIIFWLVDTEITDSATVLLLNYNTPAP